MLPSDFDWYFYTNFYDDLNGMNQKQAQKHFINHGLKEKRLYKGVLPKKENDPNTFSIGGKVFKSPNLTISQTWCSNYQEVVSKYGDTCICFISQGGGKYELMSKILTYSLRSFNPNIEIIVGLPTPHHIYPRVSQDTLDIFDQQNVKYVEIENQINHDYKIGNKYAILEKACELSKNKYVLFLDTDVICTNPFFPSIEMLEADFSAIPTDYSDWVNKIPKKFEKSFWYEIHKVCGAIYNPDKYNPPYVSIYSKSNIYADYFNGGYLFMKNNLEIPKTLNIMTKKIYNHLLISNKSTFTSDQIAIAVTSSKLNLKCHAIDRLNCDHCIPRYYPNHFNKQQFFHYHKLAYLRGIFINFDLRVYRSDERGLYRHDGNLIFDNVTFQRIVRCMLEDWKYFFKQSTDEKVTSDLNHMIKFLKEEVPKVDENYQGPDVRLKIFSQLNFYLNHEPVSMKSNLVSMTKKKKLVVKKQYQNLYQLIHE